MNDKTLQEAVRAAYEHGFNSVPAIAAILPDGTPAAHWAGLDAAIATMFERLRTPSEGVLKAGVEAANKLEKALYQLIIENGQNSVDMDAHYRTLAREQFIGTLTAFQQENSDA